MVTKQEAPPRSSPFLGQGWYGAAIIAFLELGPWVYGLACTEKFNLELWRGGGRGREGERERKKGRYLVHIYIMLFTLDLVDFEQIICTSWSE